MDRIGRIAKQIIEAADNPYDGQLIRSPYSGEIHIQSWSDPDHHSHVSYCGGHYIGGTELNVESAETDQICAKCEQIKKLYDLAKASRP